MIADLAWRERHAFEGRVRSMRIRPWADVATLECVVADETGAVAVVFLGRRHVAGIRLGTRLWVDGTAGEHNGRLAVLNPTYEIRPD